METTFETELEPIKRLLSKDLKAAAKLLSKAEVRYLVDSYYLMQEDRKRFANQHRALLAQEEPSNLIPWLTNASNCVELEIKKALAAWSEDQPAGQWLLSITGIGPVITAGLLAHIDPERATTAGKIWRYAGLDPTVVWKKGEKRPWCAELKTVCWKCGESFVKFSGHEDDIYGKLWAQRKEYEQRRNDAGVNREYALGRKDTVSKSTEAYKHYSQGKLPPGQIHARAKRYAVKIFLSHLQHVLYRLHFKTMPPKPWIIEHGGHVNMIAVPNLHVIGLK